MPTESKTEVKNGSFFDKIVNFLNLNSKKVIIALIILTGAALTATAAIWYAYSNNYAAIVGDKKITKSAYDKAAEQCRAGLKFAKDEKNPSLCTQKAIEDLIYLESLRQEATKNNIDVTNQVKESYQEFISTYKNEEEALEYYKRDFGLEKTDVMNNLEARALEDALSDKLLKKVSLISVFARYDFFEDTDGKEVAVKNATDIVKKYFEEPTKAGKSKAQLFEIAEKIRTENPKFNNPTQTAVGVQVESDLNDSNYSDFFQDGNKVDWDEIKKLQKPGDTTPIFVSPAGGVIIWRLEGTNNAQYGTWDQYRESVIKKSKIVSLNYRFHMSKMAVLKVVAPKAYALCSAHMGGLDVDKVYFVGTTTSVAANSIEVRFSENTDHVASGYKLGCSTAINSGTINPTSGNFTLGNGSSYLNCNSRWNIRIETRNGTFFPLRYIERSFPSNGTTIRMDRALVDCNYNGGSGDCAAYVQSYYNATQYYTINNDSNELSDNDKIIIVRPNHPPKTALISPSAGATFDTTTTSVALTVKADDPDGDDVKSAIRYYKKNIDGTWPDYTAGDWAGGGYLAAVNDNTNSSSTVAGLTPGEYRWCAKSRDNYQEGMNETLLANSLCATGYRYFSILTAGGQFDYSLSNSGNITVVKPASGSVTESNEISASLISGTTQNVTFTQSGLPAGITAGTITACSPSCGPQTNTLTISSTAAVGTSTITVTGRATNGLQRTTTYNLEIAAAPNPSLAGCTISPISGLAPLAVRITATGSNLSSTQRYDYDLQETTATNKLSPFFYTYSLPNSYLVRIKLAGADASTYRECSTRANVTSESGGTGGEVAP